MRFYGTGFGCGACLNNASHIVVRKNKIHNLQNGVFVSWTGGEDRGNDTRIEYNEFYDPPLNEWPWNAVKGTAMEATAIVLRGHIGTIVRGNHIHNYFNGIYTSSSAALDNPALHSMLMCITTISITLRMMLLSRRGLVSIIVSGITPLTRCWSVSPLRRSPWGRFGSCVPPLRTLPAGASNLTEAPTAG